MDDAQTMDRGMRRALRGGRVAFAKPGDPGLLTWKGQRDVVTGATLEVQQAIVSVLQNECPDDAILVEEGPEDEPLAVDAERLWIVDPVCGTLSFAQGIPFFAVSIALRVEGVLRVGVVYDPIRDETFAATLGAPATLNNRPITVLNTALGPEFWEQAWVATDLPPSGPRREIALRIFGVFAREVLQQYVWGSPALGLCYVAAGRIPAYWTLDAQPWGVAPACVIPPSARGLLTDPRGRSRAPPAGSFIPGQPRCH